MCCQDDINTEHKHEVNRPRGSGSVDKAPDSQWQTRVRIREAHIFDFTIKDYGMVASMFAYFKLSFKLLAFD